MTPNRPPMRQYVFRLVAPLLGVVVGVIVVVALIDWEHPHSKGARLPGWVLPLAIMVVVVVWVAAAVVGVIVGRSIAGRHVEVALRRPGQKWAHGRLTFAAGAFTFERYRFQMRIPSGDKTTYRIHGVGEDSGRRPSLKNVWTINPQLHIIELETDRGPLELGALPYRIPDIRERLTQPRENGEAS